jgi:hypothetical protein
VTGRVVAAFARLMESGGPKAEALVLPFSARERDILTLLGTGAPPCSRRCACCRMHVGESVQRRHQPRGRRHQPRGRRHQPRGQSLPAPFGD